MKAVSSGAATIAIARLSLTRFLRSRILLVAAVFAFLPLLPFLLGADSEHSVEHRWESFFKTLAYVHMLVASLLMAPAIAEEIEDKTYTYLWSRPISRWSVLAGKLLVGTLLAATFVCASAAAGIGVAGMPEMDILVQSFAALLLGVLAVGCIASSLGILLPKHPLAGAITYFLVLDSMIGALPFSGARISVMHNVIELSGNGDGSSMVTSLLWLMGIALLWITVALWLLGRKELSTGS
jgi:ABC-type transport system involved in multi-copper enzyme maturation permease subunit